MNVSIPRLVLLALVASAALLVGCPPTRTGDCSLERCEVWVCGEPMPQCPCSDLCERPSCAEAVVYGRDPDGRGCVELLSPCEVPQGWDYFSDLASCESGAFMCTANSDCFDDEVCDLTSCALDAVGVCVARPESCSEGGEAVFDCAGRLHANDCERLLAGARLGGVVSVEGSECTDVGVWARNPSSGACGFYASSCFAPEGWPYFFDRDACEGPSCSTTPVWSYSSAAGMCIEYESDCDVPEGEEFFLDADDCTAAASLCGGPAGVCPEGLVCDLRGCDAEIGRCVPRPEGCAVIMESGDITVCGCDGWTYATDCERLIAGVALASTGSCGAE